MIFFSDVGLGTIIYQVRFLPLPPPFLDAGENVSKSNIFLTRLFCELLSTPAISDDCRDSRKQEDTAAGDGNLA
jgi:hypothetical protein